MNKLIRYYKGRFLKVGYSNYNCNMCEINTECNVSQYVFCSEVIGNTLGIDINELNDEDDSDLIVERLDNISLYFSRYLKIHN